MDVCPQTMCSLLPVGYVLLACDSYHDLRWCFTPSESTSRQLKKYYSTILTPRLLPMPFPGFLFPIWVIYIFLAECPDWIGWSMFALYVPLCKRYYAIKKKRDDLSGWWQVLLIRVGLAVLTYKGIEQRGCDLLNYGEYFKLFMRRFLPMAASEVLSW